ncbi:LLM class flavin-dependent oxidoreductase [Amycolatopsis ultiminotia]|uniref:LLM class flavin-dependent oxidoreductase n=1 Tax=Amycolatopsis ultiminotia TaxID=543629 RepID=A0ABP6YG59_9PSEU
MDIGIGLPTTVPGTPGADLVEFARRADERGFSTLAVLDRFVYDSYDSIVALAAAATATKRIRIAATVLLAAYRPGIAELAKQLASVDRLSGGRLAVGVSAGGREDDFKVNGTRYSNRGRRLDALLEELTHIWSGADGGTGPRPERGEIPLWVGGHSEAALRRAARSGSAWISPGGTAARYPDLVARAEAAFAEAGRTERPHMVSLAYFALGEQARGGDYLRDYYSYIGQKADMLARGLLSTKEQIHETVAGFAEAGCDELLFIPCTADPAQVDLLAEAALA